MADALCGPSNALQNFQKHTAVDRTLQQDRIVNRHPSTQNFRSQHHNAAVLDPEFEAFENNFVGNAPPQLMPSGPAFAAPVHSQPLHGFAPAEGDWASDFQKLQVSGPSANIQQGQGMPNQAFRPVAMNGWQTEFMQHQQPQPQQNTQPQFRQGPMTSFQPSFMPSYQGMNGMVAPAPVGQALMQTASTTPAAFDESAFEAAFNQAQADMHEQEIALSEQHQIPEEDLQSKAAEPTLEGEPAEKIRIGSDLIETTEETNAQDQKEDPDELARTAGHLLDSLSHDTSQKFKESSFLALMRRIRDREVHIEGDEFREVSTLPRNSPYTRVGRIILENAGLEALSVRPRTRPQIKYVQNSIKSLAANNINGLAANMALEGGIPITVDLSDHTTSIPQTTSAFCPITVKGVGSMGSGTHPEQGAFSPVNCIYIPYDGVF